MQAKAKFTSRLPVPIYRVFSHDVTAAILVSQNNEMAAMLVSQTNPVGVELFSFLMQTLSFVSINLPRCWPGMFFLLILFLILKNVFSE